VGVRVKIYLIPQRAADQPYYRFSPFSEKSGFEPSWAGVRVCNNILVLKIQLASMLHYY
jgi:hypothetical protein